MADHKVQRPTANKPLTRRQKEVNIAILREKQPGLVAAAAKSAPSPSVSSLLRSRGETIDAAVANTTRQRANQSTDANN